MCLLLHTVPFSPLPAVSRRSPRHREGRTPDRIRRDGTPAIDLSSGRCVFVGEEGKGGKQMEAKGDTRLLSEQPDRETAHLPEVGRVHRVPERECCCTDEQI